MAKIAKLTKPLINRIVGHGEERVDQMLANPLNFRLHPDNQQQALAGAIDDIGFIRSVTVNQRTGRVVDGHLRVTIAARSNVETLPVEYVDLDEAEEAQALLSLDPIAAMAASDKAKLDELMRAVQSDDERVQQMMADLAEREGLEYGKQEQPPAGNVIYTDEQIIDAAFTYFRATGFPYHKMAIHASMQEINKLAQTEPEKLLRSNAGYWVADTYHPHRMHSSADGMKSPYYTFLDDTAFRKSLRLELEFAKKIQEDDVHHLILVNGSQACANFRPGFACYLYRKYCKPNSIVLDTSTGYGGRLVGAIASGVVSLYIGIDPNKPTHEGNERMAQELGFAEKIELYNLPAEDVDPEAVRGRCDFAFTSPPYFAKEHYSEDDTQSWVRYKTGDEWRTGFLRKMIALQFAALKPGSFAIVNIADVKVKNKTYPLEEWAVEDGKAAGFEYVKTDRFELTRRFGAGMEDEVASEPVIIFRKPELLTP